MSALLTVFRQWRQVTVMSIERSSPTGWQNEGHAPPAKVTQHKKCTSQKRRLWKRHQENIKFLEKIERNAGRCHKGSNMCVSLHVRPMYVVAHEFTRLYMYMRIQLCMCEYECMCVYMNECMNALLSQRLWNWRPPSTIIFIFEWIFLIVGFPARF